MFDRAGHPLSFENLHFTTLAMAEALHDRGVRARDTVGVALSDPVAHIAILLALSRLGVTIVTGSTANPADVRPFEIDRFVADVAVADAGDRQILVDQSWVRAPSVILPEQDDTNWIIRTSGTTGEPKHRFMSGQQFLERLKFSMHRRPPIDGISYMGTNSATVAGIDRAFSILLSGQTLVHPARDIGASLQRWIDREVAIAFIPSGQLPRFLNAADGLPDRPKHLRLISVGGGAISNQIAQQAEDMFRCAVINTYGSTESGSIAHHRPCETPEVQGVVGRPYKGHELRFVPESGGDVPSTHAREIMVRSPPSNRLRDWPSGAPIADADGWVSTGDLGRLRYDGMLVLEGRVSDLLNVGGNKLAPAHFEGIAQQLSAVREVAAFARKNAAGSDDVGIAVVMAEGTGPDEVAAHLARALGPLFSFYVYQVEALPMTAHGKLDRRTLAIDLADA